MSASSSLLLRPGVYGASGDQPVRIGQRSVDILQVFARKGRAADIAERIASAYGLTLPSSGRVAEGPKVTALWIQPDAWMLTAARGYEGALARNVKSAVGDAASVVDQTHGRSIYTLSGNRAPWVLGKIALIDLHPSVFGPGSVASSPVAHLACTIHCRDDLPTYELTVFTTFARSFIEHLTHAAEETGYIVD